MADIISPVSRSKNMSAIKSKDTKPEIYFRKKLFALGLRYRKNVSYIYGHPDIYFKEKNVAIFIHGCYWHRHSECKYAYTPKSRIDFWSSKFENNIKRDAVVRDYLSSQKIRCLVVWECTIKQMIRNKSIEKQVLDKTLDFMKSDNMYLEL